jgi:hypothetical protein
MLKPFASGSYLYLKKKKIINTLNKNQKQVIVIFKEFNEVSKKESTGSVVTIVFTIKPYAINKIITAR